MDTVKELMAANREAIVKYWHDLVLDTYPEETAKLWKKGGDPMQNPVAHRVRQGVSAVFDSLMTQAGTEPGEEVLTFLDEIIRVRAVQNFSPSGAVGFIFLLKKAVREILWPRLSTKGAWAELLALESRIDGLALACLDMYAKCRETLYGIKVEELRKQQHMLLRRAQLIVGIGEGGPAE